MLRPRTRALLPMATLTGAATIAGMAFALGGDPSASPPPVALDDVVPVVSTFSDCDALLDYHRRHGRDLVGPHGWIDGGPVVSPPVAAAEGGAPVQRSAETATGAPPAADTRSGTGTNVQVAGVDEADVAKRSGDLLLTVAGTFDRPALTVLRTAGGRAEVIGRLRTGQWRPTELLVRGSTVLLIGPQYQSPRLHGSVRPVPGRRIMPVPPEPPGTRIVQVDLSNPVAPRRAATLDVDGTVVGSRLVGGVARLTVTSTPFRVPLTFPRTGSPEAATRAETENRRAVQRAGVDAWLPQYRFTPAGGAASTGRLVDCADVAFPSRFSGLGTLSLLAFDLDRPAALGSWERAGLVASGTTVYATADRTYVATPEFRRPLPERSTPSRPGPQTQTTRTQIHLFETRGAAKARYLASGQVDGTLLDQFSLDESGGRLRVASTSEPVFAAPEGGAPGGGRAPGTPSREGPSAVSQSSVTVLEPDGDRLVQVGRVTGLGRTETIRSVRFLGDLGYVVTFRQTDPLYTVDLSDPRRPRVAGELKIPGYSAYLHPAGDGLLLGVGQDATKQGAATGLQMSLFDVSDAANPRRVGQVTLPGAWSGADGDHHAFTFVGGLALVPFDQWREAEELRDVGVVAVRVDGTDLSPATILRSNSDGPVRPEVAIGAPLRTFVDGGVIWTVTEDGVSAHDAGTLQRRSFVRF